MKRILTVICLGTLLLSAGNSAADEAAAPTHQIGTLTCNILPHSGFNLLIHSTSEIRCTFTPSNGNRAEKYKGETGIEFGVDMNFNKRTEMAYSVLSDRFAPGTGQLSGKYSGVGGGVTLGVSVGNSAPIRNHDKNISLQPVQSRNSGAGVAGGFTYLYLEPDNSQ
ncbi:DUF992 domain-containing protein [Mariprofundus ferrooxydans]|uniref:DUF992 domain-containing protein n=1 Tax=Mariprofundus ferrooxydans TaxID=314344 RepID=UPI000378B6D1|nr:DUF992 domain-containing protein [Mariprofundus ferrooxydans]